MDVPLSTIIKALDLIPENALLMSKHHSGEHRKYAVSGNNKVAEIDLGFLDPVKGYKGFVLVIDLFCRRIWAKAIRNKTREEVSSKLDLIFEESGKFEEVSRQSQKNIIQHCKFDSSTFQPNEAE